MSHKFSLLIGGAALVALSACGGAGGSNASNSFPTQDAHALNLSNPARAPKEWLIFCGRYAHACRAEARAALPLTSQNWKLLVAVNHQVNQKLDYVDDSAATGTVDSWDLLRLDNAIVKGDCEDAALTKKELLIAKGVPAGAMRLALVQQPHHKGRGVVLDHAVLVVETTGGSFVLDSLDYRITAVDQSDYRFLKVTAPTPADPHGWAWVHGAKQTVAQQ